MDISDLKNNLIPYLKSLGIKTNSLTNDDLATCFDVIKKNLEKINNDSNSLKSMSIDDILSMGVVNGKIINDLKSKAYLKKTILILLLIIKKHIQQILFYPILQAVKIL